jgi:adenylate cyclase
VRLSLSVKFGLLSVLLVVAIAGLTSYLMVFRLAGAVEDELYSRDREMAKMLSRVQTSEGLWDHYTLGTIVDGADRAKIGLVYALHVKAGGALVWGRLNPRLFSSLDPSYEAHIARAGSDGVLRMLAANKIDREDSIKEYPFGAPNKDQLRLGFDLQRIDQQIRSQQRVAIIILVAGLAIGIAAAVLVARRVAAPVKRLAGAMDAVARGEVNQTVHVTTTDELASLARSFNKMTRALREVERVRELFGRYMSPEVVQRLLKEADPLEMVAEERGVTVASIAFHEFSPLSRQLGPRQTIHLVNEYLAPIIDAVTSRQGIVDRLDGDRLVAVWGAPFDVPEPELQAIRAALAARTGVEQEARRQAAAGSAALHLCIGICTGRAVAGNIGSAVRVAYRVIGGAVELASHIQQMAQPGEILVSEATYGKVRAAVEARACAPLILEDMEEAVPLYRVESATERT